MSPRARPCGRGTRTAALASTLAPSLLVVAMTAAAFGPATAQTPRLEQIESLVAAADYDAARAALDRWWSARENTRVTGADRARALMLRARLATDPAAAEADYLSIVLGYPLSPDAPQALLRLGQGLLAVGEPGRATGYLQRLVADYPGRPERAPGLLWLARAQHASRQAAAACETARAGLRDTRDPDLVAMLRAEESAACAGAAPGVAATAPEPPAVEAPAPQRDVPPRPPPGAAPSRATAEAAPSGRFAVQTGAYRQQESVDDAVARLRRAGYDPRVVVVPGSTLLRVRVGRFGTLQEAQRLMAQLKSGGFDAVVTADATREGRP